MIYKDFDIKPRGGWKNNTNVPPSRFIEFNVVKDVNESRFVFNKNMLDTMAEENGEVRLSEDKLELEAIEIIKKYIDLGSVFNKKIFYFELFTNNALERPIPTWYPIQKD